MVTLSTRRKYQLAGIVAIVVGLAVFGTCLFRNAAGMLVVADPEPEQLDLLFTFGGHENRGKYSAEVFRNHPQVTWVFSHGSKKVVRDRLRDDSLSLRRVVFSNRSSSTVQEVKELREWVKRERETRNIRKDVPLHVGLVTSPYHMKRASLLSSLALNSLNVRLYRLPVPFSDYGPYIEENYTKPAKPEIRIV